VRCTTPELMPHSSDDETARRAVPCKDVAAVARGRGEEEDGGRR
jgi:hypothetical protein